MKDIVETKNNVKTKTTKTHKFCKNFMNEIIEAAAAGLLLLNAGYLQKSCVFSSSSLSVNLLLVLFGWTTAMTATPIHASYFL